MKRAICIALALLFLLGGCASGKKEETTVSFYYRRLDTVYGTADGVIASEERTLTGDLNQLLTAYFLGPEDETLTLPFPEGTRLLKYSSKNSVLTLSLSEEFAQLEGMDLTIACACIASTCFALTDIYQVQVTTPGSDSASGISFTLTRDSLVLFDEITETESTSP